MFDFFLILTKQRKKKNYKELFFFDLLEFIYRLSLIFFTFSFFQSMKYFFEKRRGNRCKRKQITQKASPLLWRSKNHVWLPRIRFQMSEFSKK